MAKTDPKKRIRFILVNLAVLTISLVVVLGLMEIVFRIVLREKVVLFPRYHSRVQYGDFVTRRIRPNTTFWHRSVDGKWKFQTNAQGYRDERDFRYEKDPAVMRILCLGDSHTEGFEVRQDRTYAMVLEKTLTQRNIPSEVYNMGVSGFGTDEALILLENEGVKYQPDAVVLGFFANDYEDNLKTGIFSVKADTLVRNVNEYIPAVRILDTINRCWIFRKLSEGSYLYSYFFNTVWDFAKQRKLQKAKAQVENSSRELAVPSRSTKTEEEIRLTDLLLERMARFCKEKGILFFICDIPTVDLENSLDGSIKQRMISAGAVVVEGSALVASLGNQAKMHVTHGHRHLSEAGHELVGIGLADAIVRERSARP
jgi:hypothetical protein